MLLVDVYKFTPSPVVESSYYFKRGPVLGGGAGGTSLSEANGDVPLDGVSFSIELYLNGVAHFWIFGVRKFFTFTVSKHTRLFVL